MNTIRAEKTIRAETYAAIRETQGSRAAIEALQQDIGSKELVRFRSTQPWEKKPAFAAYIMDINVIAPDRKGMSGFIEGFAETKEDALECLLDRLLDPGEACLGIGTLVAPHTQVRVQPIATPRTPGGARTQALTDAAPAP